MLNMMRADLVVIEEPIVVKSYQDIIDREDVHITFLKGVEEIYFFKYAKERTLEHEIWKKTIIVDEVNEDTMNRQLHGAVNQSQVGILRDWALRSFVNFLITKMHDIGYNSTRILLTKDETGKLFTNGWMIQRHAHKLIKEFYAEQLVKNIFQYIRYICISFRVLRISQSGIYIWFMGDRVPAIFGESELNFDKFISNKLFLPDPPPPKIRINNIHKLYYIYFTLLFISSLDLLYEKFINIIDTFEKGVQETRRRRRRKRRKTFLSRMWNSLFKRVIVV